MTESDSYTTSYNLYYMPPYSLNHSFLALIKMNKHFVYVKHRVWPSEGDTEQDKSSFLRSLRLALPSGFDIIVTSALFVHYSYFFGSCLLLYFAH